MWLGYFEECPNYLTKGENLSDPEENPFPGVRSTAGLALE